MPIDANVTDGVVAAVPSLIDGGVVEPEVVVVVVVGSEGVVAVVVGV